MEIDLTEQVALILGRDGPLVGPISASLSRCGAKPSLREPAQINSGATVAEVLKSVRRLDVLIFISPTLCEPERQPEAGAAVKDFAAAVGTLDSFVQAASDSLAVERGRIIVLGSVLGLLPARRNPLQGLPDATLFTLVREIAMRLGSRQVRVNGIAVGAIGGANSSKLLAGDGGFLSHAAVKRPGTVQDVTNAVLFLADPANTYMTGHVLTVDGGWTAGFARDF
jgi:NAD(P)-dependent dehydrogenase (short-subunit alcohol dehydrogenase family)